MPNTLRLPVKLTDDERLNVGSDLSAAITALEEAKARKKEVTSEHNKSIKNIEARVHELNVSWQTGTVERDVACEEFEDLETGLIKKRRIDTGEILGSRPMDPEERQLKIGGTSLEDVQKLIATAANKTEEQIVAATPEEAEELRNKRLADEAAERAGEGPRMPVAGDVVEVLPTGDTEWVSAEVTFATEHNFQVVVGGHEVIIDEVQHGAGWRWPTTWSDVTEASRQAEIDRLAAEQDADAKKDGPKHLLKAPKGKGGRKGGEKKNGEAKRVTVVDKDENVIARGGEEAGEEEMPAPPDEEPKADDDGEIAF
jgi:hypothetical protein